MGTYATTSSISELIPNFLVDNTTTADSAGTAIFSRHITRSEGVVNTYVSARYSLPFTSTSIPPIVRSLSEDLASYYTLRGSFTQDGANKNAYAEEYKDALEMLEKIRQGEILLTLTNGSAAPTSVNNRILSSTENYTPIYGRDNATNWNRDADEISDQEAARQ